MTIPRASSVPVIVPIPASAITFSPLHLQEKTHSQIVFRQTLLNYRIAFVVMFELEFYSFSFVQTSFTGIIAILYNLDLKISKIEKSVTVISYFNLKYHNNCNLALKSI